METKITTPITKGLIISLILITISMIAYFTGQQDATWNKLLGVIIFLGAIIWACQSYGKQLQNNVTFGNLFGHGFKVSAVVTLIIILYTVVFFLIFPEMKEKGMETARQEMEKGGKLTEDQIDQAINITNKFFYAFAIGGILLFYLIVGAIASLIGAAVTKKQPVTPFENQS